MKIFMLAAALLCSAAVSFAQNLTDDQINQAIARGNSKKHHAIGLELTDQQTAFISAMACKTCAVSGYVISVYNPEQWIEMQSSMAKRAMAPYSIANVTPEMRQPLLRVLAWPSKAAYLNAAGMSASSSVSRVVLSDTARQTTIQPLDLQHGTVQSNSAFRSFEYTSASAVFQLSDVANLQHSDSKGEFFIVVVGGQNKFFKVKSKYLRVLFP
jgi:hypothetical protein